MRTAYPIAKRPPAVTARNKRVKKTVMNALAVPTPSMLANTGTPACKTFDESDVTVTTFRLESEAALDAPTEKRFLAKLVASAETATTGLMEL